MSNKKINHALIMAAGRGIRLIPLSNRIPKAMAPLSGSTLINRGINRIKKTIPNIHITVGYKGAMLASHVIEQSVNSVFNTEGKGNAWWLFNTLISNINEPILVLTCDNVVKFSHNIQLKEYYRLGNPACMIIPTYYNPYVEADFVFFDKKQKVQKINRKNQSKYICSGIQILNPKKINEILKPLNNFRLVWSELIKKKQVYCSSKVLKNWFSVDNMEQLKSINNNF
tara:strand:+ start:2880 stop:3560 length:681 start_codon:yes stop_codon:yes gene_type:complete